RAEHCGELFRERESQRLWRFQQPFEARKEGLLLACFLSFILGDRQDPESYKHCWAQAFTSRYLSAPISGFSSLWPLAHTPPMSSPAQVFEPPEFIGLMFECAAAEP
ncbi:unnamed protein product, partial [Discosporangium mesarthrocarpum]